jgi:hypothetical protein
MFVEHEIISATAQLILAGMGSLPVEDDAEWRGWDGKTAEVMQELIDELNWVDLLDALKAAAARLPEPPYEDEVEEDDVPAEVSE